MSLTILFKTRFQPLNARGSRVPDDHQEIPPTKPAYHEELIPDFESYLSRVSSKQPCAHWIYRGVKSKDFRLIPTLGRIEKYTTASDEEKSKLELNYLKKTRSAVNPSDPNFYEAFSTAVAAQHHGAPTRLLDWTESPLIAAYFACEPRLTDNGKIDSPKNDVAIFAAHCCPDEVTDFRQLNYPFCNPAIGSFAVRPPLASERVEAQLSVLTVSCMPSCALELEPSLLITRIDKLIISKDLVGDFQRRLHRLGIRKRGLFPDADGHNSSLLLDDALDDALASLCNA